MSRPPLPSENRLARLSLWLCLTVTWFVAHVLARLAPHAANRALTQYAHVARVLLVARALRQIGVSRKRTHLRIDARRLTVRRVCGKTLRRELRRGTISDRADAIRAVLAAPESWIAHLVRRLKRRFTKLSRLPALRRARLCAWPHAQAPTTFVNSS